MKISHWDHLTRKQRVICYSRYNYYMVLHGAKPFHYLEWSES